MKYVLFFLFISLKSSAQTDTSRQVIRLSFMQKHIAYMGAELSERNTLQDQRTRDTLAARIGSGTKPDSVTTGGYPAGFVLKFFQRLTDEQTGTAYDFFRELINGKTGYVGIVTQLNQRVNGGDLTALWLRSQLQELIQRKEAVMIEKLKGGAAWLKEDL